MLGELAQEKTLKLTVQFSKQFSADSGLESADSVNAGLASADSKFLTFRPHAPSISFYVYGLYYKTLMFINFYHILFNILQSHMCYIL